jgi:hypothetical protein
MSEVERIGISISGETFIEGEEPEVTELYTIMGCVSVLLIASLTTYTLFDQKLSKAMPKSLAAYMARTAMLVECSMASLLVASGELKPFMSQRIISTVSLFIVLILQGLRVWSLNAAQSGPAQFKSRLVLVSDAHSLIATAVGFALCAVSISTALISETHMLTVLVVIATR